MSEEFDRETILAELVELAGFTEERQPADVSVVDIVAATGKTERSVRYHLEKAVKAGTMDTALRFDNDCNRVIRVWWKL